MSGPLIQLLQRRDLAATWTLINPILAEGQIGIETDTGWHKIGDGATAWADLGYYHGPLWWNSLDGGSPSSTFAGEPAPGIGGVMAYVDLNAPKSIVSTTVFGTSDFFTTRPDGAVTDGNGNWVLICDNDHIFYSSDPVNTWTETASVISAATDPTTVAVNDSGLWIAFGFGQNTVYTSTDLGVTWTERRDQTTNYNGVNAIFWSPTLQTFFTNGQLQMRLTTDGITWTGGFNGSTSSPGGFKDTGSALYIWGHAGGGNPRNGYTTDSDALIWTMHNDLPTAGSFNGTPHGPGDWDGTNWVLAAGVLNYRYWVSPTMTNWNYDTDFRYDSAKTDAINLLKYIPAEQKWYLITNVGDVYWSSDPSTGESGWTEITTGNMVGIIPTSVQTYAHNTIGSDAWCYTATLSKFIVNKLG